ncbi:MAG: hypothetical protein K9L32_07725 [Chromatiaceae bacterium]|nr:hypothetical protein [Chromatiaceae bacterium]
MSNRILPWSWTHLLLEQTGPHPRRCLLAMITAAMLASPLAAFAEDESSTKASDNKETASAANEGEDDATADAPTADHESDTDADKDDKDTDTDTDTDTKTDTDNLGRLSIELNKLEQVEDICRVYFVFENAIDQQLETLQLELVLFDTKGFVKRRLTLDAAPIAKDKTSVKLFDLPETQCTNVGRILINDVVKIAGPDGDLPDDVSQLDLSSKLDADLFK